MARPAWLVVRDAQRGGIKSAAARVLSATVVSTGEFILLLLRVQVMDTAHKGRAPIRGLSWGDHLKAQSEYDIVSRMKVTWLGIGPLWSLPGGVRRGRWLASVLLLLDSVEGASSHDQAKHRDGSCLFAVDEARLWGEFGGISKNDLAPGSRPSLRQWLARALW